MAHLSISLLEHPAYEDKESAPVCILACKDGKISIQKQVLTLNSNYWRGFLKMDDEIGVYPMSSLTVNEVERIGVLLWDKHLILPVMYTTQFYTALDHMQISAKLITRLLARIKPPIPGLLPLNNHRAVGTPSAQASSSSTVAPLTLSANDNPSSPQIPESESLELDAEASDEDKEPTVIRPEPKLSDIVPKIDGLYNCILCKQKFKSKRHYYVHYPGDYRCEYCGKAYTRRDNLSTHVRIAHNPYSY